MFSCALFVVFFSIVLLCWLKDFINDISKKMPGHFVRRTEEVAGQSVRQLKILISRLENVTKSKFSCVRNLIVI